MSYEKKEYISEMDENVNLLAETYMVCFADLKAETNEATKARKLLECYANGMADGCYRFLSAKFKSFVTNRNIRLSLRIVDDIELHGCTFGDPKLTPKIEVNLAIGVIAKISKEYGTSLQWAIATCLFPYLARSVEYVAEAAKLEGIKLKEGDVSRETMRDKMLAYKFFSYTDMSVFKSICQ